MGSLLHLCIESVVKFHDKFHPDNLRALPHTLKDEALIMMCKRGQLTDDNADMFLHRDVIELNLSECNIGDKLIKEICQCSRLRFVNLGSLEYCRNNISSREIEALATTCPHLTTILLHNCINITDTAIIQLSKHCQKLVELDISECNLITDHSLLALGENAAYLTCISISGTRVTDNGIRNLVKGINGSHLKEIVMKRCLLLTDQALELIISCCPSLTILNFNGCPKITDRSRERVSRQQGALSNLRQISWTIY